jgi:hypothetical protein
VRCSDIFGNAGGNAICGTDAGRNFSLDPLFCDLAANNYRLQNASPCYPGHHPDGPNGSLACGNRRIGAQDPGCILADVTDAADLGGSGLLGNDPNPFTGSTMIRFAIGAASDAEVGIFDVAGRQVRHLDRRTYQPGSHRVAWDGRDDAGNALPSGVYFTRLTADGRTTSRALLLTR